MTKNKIIEKRKWYLIDAADKSLGRLATEITTILRGKNLVTFTPYLDQGGNVVVINTDKIKLTGRKEDQKKYYHYSGYPGGMKERKYKDVFAEDSGKVLKETVRMMLPSNKIRMNMLKRLRCFKNANHPYKKELSNS